MRTVITDEARLAMERNVDCGTTGGYSSGDVPAGSFSTTAISISLSLSLG